MTVFEYMDYRRFLRDFIEHKKQKKNAFSFRYVAMRLGCNAGFFNRVIKGARNLSAGHVLQLMDILGLPARERKYFEILVQYNQSRLPEEKDHFFRQLKQQYNSKIRKVSEKQYPMYDHWYNVVLREMLHAMPCYDISDSTCRKLSNFISPSIRPADIRKSLQTLAALNIITQTSPDGRLRLNEKLMTTGPDIPPLVVQGVLRQFFELGTQSLERYEKTERVCAAVTVSISEEGYSEIKSRLDQCRKEILDIADRDRKQLNRIYHLNMQLFPMTKPLTTGG